MGGMLENPLTAVRDREDRALLTELFPELQACPGSSFLALRPYLHRRPDRFFSRPAYSLMLDWLNRTDRARRAELQKYFSDANAELSAAMMFLRQINSEDWHDRSVVKGDDYDVARFIDQVLHPAYLRLAEAVLAPFIRPIAFFARMNRGKGTEGLDVFNLVQELSGGPMALCVAAYQHTVRNGIGHGGITYLQRQIRYRDKKGNTETLDVWSVIQLCDDMVDICNALAAALKVFLIISLPQGYELPHELVVEELMEETATPWWAITGCINSETAQGTQLLIYARPESRDMIKILWASLQSAVLAEALAPGYDLYFLSLDGSKALPGWAIFEGRRLRDSRATGAFELRDYAIALADDGFFYVPRPALPRVLGRAETFLRSVGLHWPYTLKQMRQSIGLPTILSREAEMHRSTWGYVLKGAVVLPEITHDNAAHMIRVNRRRIVRAAARAARSTYSPINITRYLPLGYARIAVFAEDFRRRRLGSYGLGPQLVCTLQFQRLRRIKAPDIFGSTIETFGKWRIAWNRAWIESGGEN